MPCEPQQDLLYMTFPPRDIKQGGPSAQIQSTDTSAQIQSGSIPCFTTEPDKLNPQHSMPQAPVPQPAKSQQNKCNLRRE